MEEYAVTRAQPIIIDGLRMRGFEFFNMISSYTFDSPRPVQLKATGRVKFQGQVTTVNSADEQADGTVKGMVNIKMVVNEDTCCFTGNVSISGLKLNQLTVAPQLAGQLSISHESLKLDAIGRPDESLAVEIMGLLDPTADDNAQHGKSLSFTLQKGQLRANMYYEPSHSANLEIHHLPLDELELGSLRGTIQRVEEP